MKTKETISNNPNHLLSPPKQVCSPTVRDHVTKGLWLLFAFCAPVPVNGILAPDSSAPDSSNGEDLAWYYKVLGALVACVLIVGLAGSQEQARNDYNRGYD